METSTDKQPPNLYWDFKIVKPACVGVYYCWYDSMQWCEWLYIWRGAAFHTGTSCWKHLSCTLLCQLPS